jgi:hypothetical protein
MPLRPLARVIMKRMRALLAIATLLLALGVAAQPLPSEQEIATMLRERLGQQQTQSDAGIAVGIIDAEGRRIRTYGGMGFDGYTIVNLGAASDVFTSLLYTSEVDRANNQEINQDTLISERVLAPLGMKKTTVAGGDVRADPGDLLTLLSAYLGDTTPLFLAATKPQPLGWHVVSRNGHDIVWRDGATRDSRFYLAFDRKRHAAVVVLTSRDLRIDDIAQRILGVDTP